mmetsp:Transcript_77837/g.215800  ORF Transcript_77837/g.215800 Transcript_77837/m.215800 type:complete len:356 (-) Transcript_77837:78-1145(-)
MVGPAPEHYGRHREQAKQRTGPPRGPGAATPAPGLEQQQGQRHQRRQHIADQLGAGHREEGQDDDDPPEVKADTAQSARQPQAQRQRAQRQHGEVEPPGLRVVEARLGVALEVLLDDEIVEEAGVALLHRQHPGQGDRGEHRQRQRMQRKAQVGPAALPQQPGQHDEARQHDADQALGQQGQRHRRPGGAQPGQAAPAGRQRAPRGHHGHRDPAGDQHVVVGVLAAEIEERQHGQHGQGLPRAVAAIAGAGLDPQRQAHDPGAQQRCDAQGQLGGPEQLQGRHVDPVHQRRLVEIRHAEQRRRQRVAVLQHLVGDAAIAAFVGQRQLPPRGQRDQPQRQCGQRPPVRPSAGGFGG